MAVLNLLPRAETRDELVLSVGSREFLMTATEPRMHIVPSFLCPVIAIALRGSDKRETIWKGFLGTFVQQLARQLTNAPPISEVFVGHTYGREKSNSLSPFDQNARIERSFETATELSPFKVYRPPTALHFHRQALPPLPLGVLTFVHTRCVRRAI